MNKQELIETRAEIVDLSKDKPQTELDTFLVPQFLEIIDELIRTWDTTSSSDSLIGSKIKDE